MFPTDNENPQNLAAESDIQPEESQDTPVDPQVPDEPLEEPRPSGISEDEERCILALFESYRKEEQETRELRIAFWKKLENYFDGIQNIFFDFSARDWRRLDVSNDNFDPNLYDKIVNIYRAHGESLIAALSIKLPRAIFYPDDADVIEDVDTAKACNDIKDIIEKDNNGILLFVKALYYLWNQGTACAYIYNRASKSYGTVQIPQYGDDVKVTHATYTCPVCNGVLGEEEFKGVEQPDYPQMATCISCGDVAPNIEAIDETLPTIIGYSDEAKSRTIIDIFGPMYAQMPFYARKQEDIPYLMLRFEQHQNMLRGIYPLLKDQISGSSLGDFDRLARMQGNQYEGYRTLVTTSCVWFRPWAFNLLNDEDAEMMTQKYPNGCYAVILNDKLVAEARNEELDKHWVVTHSPLSNFIHAEPMGKTLAPLQDIRNEATDLAIETFEHSIPETFADPDVLNFTLYGQEESRPGMKYPAKPKQGRTLGESFHSLKSATVNDEIDNFIKHTDADAQFVSGSFPSIYGGPNTSGSKTAREYSESRAMALQRLNITWTVLKDWWARVMSCAVQEYMGGMLTDERIVQEAPSGTGYLNKWLMLSQTTGKIGRVDADASEELPTSFAQIKSVIMELLTLKDPTLSSALFHPQNTPILTKAIGIPNAYIPGADERNKQYSEIADLLKSGPLPTGLPTVSINEKLDDHEVEMEVIKSWANSPTGLATKQLNPMGFENVMAHYFLHEMALTALMQPMVSKEDTESQDNNQPPSEDTNA